MIKKNLKLYEAYRHSDILNEDIMLSEVKAYSAESAYKWFKERFKKMYGDEKPFSVREKK